ncbi:MAG: CorA family divalent cation transporter, partial [Saprospiraceae bacterium]|nr:CorA family divalent cation transporter [Saprospiraceae bacterium]
SSSRYFEEEQEINANLNYIYEKEGSYSVDPVSFILKEGTLITQRNIPLRSFEEAKRQLRNTRRTSIDGFNVFLALFEIRIDLEADFLELLSKRIYAFGKRLALNKELEQDVLIEIYNLQEVTILFRETTSELKRLFSSILRSDFFPKDEYEKIRVLIKDADSLLGHTNFNFERLEYLQDTFMGLIDIEQNQIIKLFTLMTVVFLPPTLIASLYGMNFEYMPELGWPYGYPFALGLMIVSSLSFLFYFRWKGWL